MEKTQLIEKLEELNQERNIIIQKLRKLGLTKSNKTIVDEKIIYDETCKHLIGKCGILENSNGTYVFKIVETRLNNFQIHIYCDYLFISTSSSPLKASYFKHSTNSHFFPFLQSKVFNRNTNSFNLSSLNKSIEITVSDYEYLTERDDSIEELRKKLDEIRIDFIEKNKIFSEKLKQKIDNFIFIKNNNNNTNFFK